MRLGTECSRLFRAMFASKLDQSPVNADQLSIGLLEGLLSACVSTALLPHDSAFSTQVKHCLPLAFPLPFFSETARVPLFRCRRKRGVAPPPRNRGGVGLTRAPQSARQVWTLIQRDDPNHLGLWLIRARRCRAHTCAFLPGVALVGRLVLVVLGILAVCVVFMVLLVFLFVSLFVFLLVLFLWLCFCWCCSSFCSICSSVLLVLLLVVLVCRCSCSSSRSSLVMLRRADAAMGSYRPRTRRRPGMARATLAV